MGVLSVEQLERMSFAAVGKNVRISDKASFHNCGNIWLGDNVRIDDFCVMSAGRGGIRIGDFIHVGVGTSLIGAGAITLADFCNLSARVAIYSSNDDYSGAYLTNPMVPKRFTNVTEADVRLGKHVIVGSGSVILPGCMLGDGVAIGALSLVKANCEEFGIYSGVPARLVKQRRHDLLALEAQLRSGLNR